MLLKYGVLIELNFVTSSKGGGDYSGMSSGGVVHVKGSQYKSIQEIGTPKYSSMTYSFIWKLVKFRMYSNVIFTLFNTTLLGLLLSDAQSSSPDTPSSSGNILDEY